jgi:hypothetical protein
VLHWLTISLDAGATMTADAMQDAAFTAGDAADQFAAIGVHSAVMKQMVKNLHSISGHCCSRINNHVTRIISNVRGNNSSSCT